jgi:uncharacterized protein YciI
MFYMLLYEVGEDFIDRRAPFREEHLGIAQAAQERGELFMAGALTDPVDGAALVFKTEDRSVVEQFVENDPYVKQGLVKSWKVRKWAVVIGGEG